MKREKEYDLTVKTRALTRLALRMAVAAYLVYAAWRVLSGTLAGGSPIPAHGAWLIFFVLAAAAAGFCVFAWSVYQRDLKTAEISGGGAGVPPEEREENAPAGSEDLQALSNGAADGREAAYENLSGHGA